MYGSDSNIPAMKERQGSLSDWVNARQAKKRAVNDSDSDSSITQPASKSKTTCCAADSLSESVNSLRDDMRSVLDAIKNMQEQQDRRFSSFQKDMADVKITIRQLNKTNEEIEKSLDYLGKKYEELEDYNRECVEKLKKQENKMTDLFQRNIHLEKCNKVLEERVCILEQKELNLNIELVNVQYSQEENTIEVVKRISKELKLNPEGIEKAWRVGKAKENRDNRPIVVTLSTQEARMEWLKSRKNNVTNHAIFKNNNNSKIYINEHVTHHLRQLFWETKMKLKETYKYIWIQNARILVKKDDTDKKIHQIRFGSDIQNLLQKKPEE
ncbi:hypothetical protein ABMA28_013233 [Loxostege sticticalis]